ncbi:MAG TPA: type 4a pilus biogenesis protein PilO [Verrucomicrobiae bacterium]|nr:type 4a pilus biogenesis protein PilO [Verrucomicrobiae bacterium]
MEIKNRQQALIVVTLALIGLWLANLVVYEPLVKWWQSRDADVRTLKQQVSEGRTLIRRESAIRDEWKHIQSNTLANDPSQAEQKLLKAFDNWASDSGVNVESITPQWQDDQNDYSTLECRVEASGDLGTLSRFIYEMENDPMTIQLEALELTASDEKGQQLTLGLQMSGLALVNQ